MWELHDRLRKYIFLLSLHNQLVCLVLPLTKKSTRKAILSRDTVT